MAVRPFPQSFLFLQARDVLTPSSVHAHSESGLQKALVQTSVLFGSTDVRSLNVDDVIHAFENDARLLRISASDLPVKIAKVAQMAGVVPSQSSSPSLFWHTRKHSHIERLTTPFFSFSSLLLDSPLV